MLLGGGCAGGSQKAQVDSNGVIGIRASDPDMSKAKQQAIDQFPGFLKRLHAKAADETDFAVKYDLTPGQQNSEFIWAGNLSLDGATLTGKLSNNPEAAGFRMGQLVVIDQSLIIDWGYRKAGVMQGHFTTRVLLTKISPEEAQSIKDSLGWK